MLIAGVNMAVFYATTAARVKGLEPDVVTPIAGKFIAGISLMAWIGVISFGRLITFYRPPDHWCFWC
jgi:hypothetical protein